jgi:hypothetical protein
MRYLWSCALTGESITYKVIASRNGGEVDHASFFIGIQGKFSKGVF